MKSDPGQRLHFVSLGCPKNQVDTELMLGTSMDSGQTLTSDPAEADIIVVNTCGFINSAKEESINTILEMAQYKEQGHCRKLIVTGCLTQRYSKELAEEIPEIDVMLGSADYQHFAQHLDTPSRARDSRTRLPVIQIDPKPSTLYDHSASRVLSGARHSAFVKIAEGCDRPCSFCIIPRLLGQQRSRSIESIATEVTRLCTDGVREINLIAQDLTRYGADLASRPTLAQLLRRLAPVPGLLWLRLHYTYPSAFTDELIDVVASHPTIARYVDVPLQHINAEMLKRMRRGHSPRTTRELIDRLRARIPDVVLRTTWIVGHPGETEDAFNELLSFVESSRFNHVGVFPYSPEPGTAAFDQDATVPPEVAIERRDLLMERQSEIARSHNRQRIGQQLDLLVDGVSGESEYLLEGRYYGQARGIDGTTFIASCSAPAGSIVRATITDASDYDLIAAPEEATDTAVSDVALGCSQDPM